MSLKCNYIEIKLEIITYFAIKKSIIILFMDYLWSYTLVFYNFLVNKSTLFVRVDIGGCA